MHLAPVQSELFDFLHLDLELFPEKLAIGLGPHGVLLNQVPQLFVLEEGLPFGLLHRVQRVVRRLPLLLVLVLLKAAVPEFLLPFLLCHDLQNVLY